ncbi:response regulator [Iocasia frigidifontis]|uniref:Stage 0 sporulation protein A homolog n=1 Tax=Iocasia fonsfrigidae TaxID=2682810 RepID=A0A8A7KLA0_9FIRM|nr:response regulator [Iocasia fonsfrigidae]QTL99607.1 response regulator [Iocasia fonsfrigidae]
MDKSLNVLIAEDESVILMGLKSNLEKLGHRVVGEALDGKQAVKLALEKKPDLILLDINMPSMDGIEAASRINEQCLIPCIIITGYNDQKLIDRATEAGVFGYLIKPVGINDIRPAIDIARARFAEFKKLQDELDNAEEALKARKLIEQAKGILMDRMDLKEAEAMRLLQKRSNEQNKKMVIIARDIIDADQQFEL